MENLAIGLIAGTVIFVMYLSNFSKKKEMKEKQKQDEFSKRLDNLTKSLEDEVTIKENILEKESEDELEDEIVTEKFKAKRAKKKD